MSIKKRQRIDRCFKTTSTMCKWIRKHINAKLGRVLLDINDSLWDSTF